MTEAKIAFQTHVYRFHTLAATLGEVVDLGGGSTCTSIKDGTSFGVVSPPPPSALSAGGVPSRLPEEDDSRLRRRREFSS